MLRHLVAPAFVLTLGVALILAAMSEPMGSAMRWIGVAAPLLAVVAIGYGFIVNRPVRPVPWMLFGAGLGVFALAALNGFPLGADGDPFPGGTEAVQALAYPALFVATISVTSTRRRTIDPLGGSEPLIYAMALTALVWIAATGPYLAGDPMPFDATVWSWLLPTLDVCLALVSLRILRRTGVLRQRYTLMAVGFLLIGAAHAACGWVATNGGPDDGALLAVAPLLGPITLAVMATLPTSGGPERPPLLWTCERLGVGRVVGLLVASLAPLGTLIVISVRGTAPAPSLLVISLASVAVIVLSVARMWRLVDQVRVVTEQRGNARLAAMIEHSSDLVLLTDDRGVITYASPGLRSMLDHEPSRWVGRELVDVVAYADRPQVREYFERLAGGGDGARVGFEVGLIHNDGRQRKAAATIANLVAGTADDGIIATFRDVTEQRTLEHQLSHRAFHDELTGVANRARFVEQLDEALRHGRTASNDVGVLFVDLDDFKAVNDAFGHAIGDQILQEVAERILRCAGPGDTAARLGGDEFALLLESVGGAGRAVDVGERLLAALREPVTAAGEQIVVLASIGVAVGAPATSSAALLRDADLAMYEAKRTGKGRVQVFDPSTRLVASRRVEYREELAHAIEHDEIRLVYMPLVDITTGQVTGAEALVRWRHGEIGEIPARELIPVAERSGLIVPLGQRITELAFGQAAAWRPGLYLGVNVSPIQIRQPEFVDETLDAAARHRLDPQSIMFEITESVFVDEDDRTVDSVRRLRAAGFRFAIDDYGAGYCSLSHLRRHPVDFLKIDRSAIAEFGADPSGNTLARSIIQLAQSLDLMTVAEGIETPAQLRELRAAGCELGQGYLLSPPLEAPDLAARFGVPDLVVSR